MFFLQKKNCWCGAMTPRRTGWFLSLQDVLLTTTEHITHKDVSHETNEGWSSDVDGELGDRSRVEQETFRYAVMCQEHPRRFLSEVDEIFCKCDNMCTVSVCVKRTTWNSVIEPGWYIYLTDSVVTVVFDSGRGPFSLSLSLPWDRDTPHEIVTLLRSWHPHTTTLPFPTSSSLRYHWFWISEIEVNQYFQDSCKTLCSPDCFHDIFNRDRGESAQVKLGQSTSWSLDLRRSKPRCFEGRQES